jgi:hypothetical protein
MIRGDSTEYELLKKWSETLPFFEEPKSITTCEIGVREGLGSQVIMMGIKKRIGKKPYEHIAIDPYGDLEYQHFDKDKEGKITFWKNDKGELTTKSPTYPDTMKIQLLKDFSNNKNFNFYHFTDRQYMNLFNSTDKVFDLVHFDGPHTTKEVMREALWFAEKTRKGSRLIFDDFKVYDMELIGKALTYWDFKVLDSGDNKIMLERHA